MELYLNEFTWLLVDETTNTLKKSYTSRGEARIFRRANPTCRIRKVRTADFVNLNYTSAS